MSNNQQSPEDLQKQQFETLKKKLLSLCKEMYHIIDPGMSITMCWTDQSDIVVPGRPIRTHEMIITRPALSIRLKAQ